MTEDARRLADLIHALRNAWVCWQLASDTERSEAAQRRIATLQSEGARDSLGLRDKDDLLSKLEDLQQVTAETDQLTLQLKRRMPPGV